jgi:hypothetical protein
MPLGAAKDQTKVEVTDTKIERSQAKNFESGPNGAIPATLTLMCINVCGAQGPGLPGSCRSAGGSLPEG